jgi:ribonuclease P/MRP protein subunit RPP40
MKFNVKKCKVMHLGSRNMNFSYNMGDCCLDLVSVEKDLGVLVDGKLNFSDHINAAVSKANRLLGLIKRSFLYMDKALLKALYIAIVHPHLEYANTVWHPSLQKHVHQLEKAQRRATRLVPELRLLPYEDRLRQLELPSLVYRRLSW